MSLLRFTPVRVGNGEHPYERRGREEERVLIDRAGTLRWGSGRALSTRMPDVAMA
jgi:hypothetical protein